MPDLNFYDAVYRIVRMIPYGRVTSYGAIAAYLGSRGSARMVGYAMNNCHAVRPPVPAHRVVSRQGLLTGKFHFGGELMRQLLEAEGIEVSDDRVIDFKSRFWDPATTIGGTEKM